MHTRTELFVSLFITGALSVVACGQDRTEPLVEPSVTEASSEKAVSGSPLRSGTYRVAGTTVQASHGRAREISGTLELRIDLEAGGYVSTFELVTTDPARGEGVAASIRGKGKGYLIDGDLVGIAWEELESSAGGSGVAIVSMTRGDFDQMGKLHIGIQNFPGPDESYSPSVTVLEGSFVAPLPPQVGAPPRSR